MKCFIVVLFLACLASSVFGQTVINAVMAPANASGLCWDGAYLWCGTYGGSVNQYVYKIDPTNGIILKTMQWRPTNWTSGSCYGLAFDTSNNGSLWVSSQVSGPDTILLVDTINGTRIRQLRAHKEYMAGLANDGQYLWHCLYYSPDGRVYHIDKTTGVPFDSFDIPIIPQPWGATWDGQYLWVCNDSGSSSGFQGTSSAYKFDVTTHQVIDSVRSPGIHPRGLAWDGAYLWIVANGPSATGKVAYQIDLGGGGTPDIQISPTSCNFGNIQIGHIAGLGFLIMNVGTDTLTVDTMFSSNPVFTYEDTFFPIRIAPGTNVEVPIYFTPTLFQLYTGSVGVVSDDPDEETVYCSLRGQGVYHDQTLSPNLTSYNFGDVRLGCVKDWYLRIVNQGFPALIINTVIFTDYRFFNGLTNFPITLNCLETTYIQVITRPDVAGSYVGNILLYNNGTPNPYNINFIANGTGEIPVGGQMLWQYDYPDNVVCVAPISDINNDSIDDVAVECYGTNMSGKKHLRTFWANSAGNGVTRWAVGDADFSGSWGDDCLIQGDDYNNDGKLDILLGTAWGDRSVYAINGLTGQILWQYDTHSYDGEGGWVYSVKPMPDITGDSIGEVIAGVGGNSSPGGGPRSVYCFNGANGSIVWQYRALDGIGSVAWIPDVSGDNVPDVIAGAWGNSLDKKVYCISGINGSWWWSHQFSEDVQSVIIIPDINGDLKPDVVAGDWSGTVKCLSGATGMSLWLTTVGGWVVKLVQIPNLISQNRPGIAVANVSGVSYFNVLNSNNGSVYWNYPIGGNIWTCDAIEDLNNDGKQEVLAGNQAGMVYCFNGANGTALWSYNAGRLIYSIRAITDMTFDGHQDVLVGTQASSSNNIAKLVAICSGAYVPGVAEQSFKAISRFSVFPHISNSSFNITFNKSLVDNVSIFDASGRLIKTFDELRGKTDRLVWLGNDNNNRPVARGVYFVKISSENHSQIEKLIVIR